MLVIIARLHTYDMPFGSNSLQGLLLNNGSDENESQRV